MQTEWGKFGQKSGVKGKRSQMALPSRFDTFLCQVSKFTLHSLAGKTRQTETNFFA